MTTNFFDLIQDRNEAIVQALHDEDLDALTRLKNSSNDEDEYRDIVSIIQGIEAIDEAIDDADWAHDRAKDNEL